MAAANDLPDAIINEAGLKITPLDAMAPDAAQTLINQAAMLLPHIKITELLLEVDVVLLMMMFGMNPVAVLASYGKFVLWTQLWLPTLAVIQFFELMTISTNTANAEGWGQAYLSYAGSANLNNLITDQLAIIGMLASSVPVICWGIVAGGSAAVNAWARVCLGGNRGLYF